MEVKHWRRGWPMGRGGSYNGRMDPLRRLRWLACCMLAWFALSAGAAVASPFVVSSSAERICSGSGQVRYMVQGDLGALPSGGHALDCPLCTPSAAPPAVLLPALVAPGLVAREPVPLSVSGASGGPAAPLPARGPPVA